MGIMNLEAIREENRRILGSVPHMPEDYSPYQDQSSTRLARLLEDERIHAQKMSESRTVDRMGREIKEIRYMIDRLNEKITLDIVEPSAILKPSVEVNDYSSGWLTRLIYNIKRDPMWEIFKIV